jgi:hypothetical protein
MVTYNPVRVLIAWTVAASFGWMIVRDCSYADEPSNSAICPAPSTPPERYLLLTNGQLIKGVISEREIDYEVAQRVGAMRFSKPRVEGAFDSIDDAYRYRVEQLPERDTEERMKLALWCLNLNLKAQAKEQFLRVVELNPQHTEAKRRLFSMQQAAEVASQRQRDPAVQQTAVETPRENLPGALDAAVIQNARRGLGISGLPVIFDLPAPLAVNRANEYFRSVHPLLQLYCARCHDGNYDGEFQLVPIKSRADRSPDALRANLDATLRLIDRDSLDKSALLSSTLRPHHGGPRSRPIFTGSNDKTYQILATWVLSLRNTKNGNEQVRQDLVHPATVNAEPFASNRRAITSDSSQPALGEPRGGIAPLPLIGNQPTPNVIPPPLRYRGNVDLSDRNGNSLDPRELEFPLPPVISGFKTPLPAGASAPKIEARNTSQPAVKTDPSMTTDTRADSNKSANPEAAAKSASVAKATGEAGATKKKSKPVTIDPTLLERALLNRNNGH